MGFFKKIKKLAKKVYKPIFGGAGEAIASTIESLVGGFTPDLGELEAGAEVDPLALTQAEIDAAKALLAQQQADFDRVRTNFESDASAQAKAIARQVETVEQAGRRQLIFTGLVAVGLLSYALIARRKKRR